MYFETNPELDYAAIQEEERKRKEDKVKKENNPPKKDLEEFIKEEHPDKTKHENQKSEN